MGLDIRVPIGGLFTTVGILLTIYGLTSDARIYERSLGINVNLEWGIVLLVFGVVMGGLGLKSKPKTSKNATESEHRLGAGGH
jgi:membrane-bound ClpP family serine protease